MINLQGNAYFINGLLLLNSSRGKTINNEMTFEGFYEYFVTHPGEFLECTEGNFLRQSS